MTEVKNGKVFDWWCVEDENGESRDMCYINKKRVDWERFWKEYDEDENENV